MARNRYYRPMGVVERTVYKGKRGTSKTGIQIDDAEVRRALIAITKAVEDMRPLWDRVNDELFTAEEEWFSSKGGGTWPATLPSYDQWEKEHGGGGLMVFKGDLEKGLTSKGGGHIFKKYAAYMEFGVKGGRLGESGLPKGSRGGRMRLALDSQSAPVQAAIKRSVEQYADEVAKHWRSGR